MKFKKVTVHALLPALVLLFFAPMLLYGVPFYRDTMLQFYPWQVFSSLMIKSGHLPFWNPYSFCGTPFLANMQSAVFYPLKVIFYLLPVFPAWKIFLVVHFWLSALGMYLFLRRKVSEWASVSGAIVWVFSGYTVARTEFLSVTGTITWLPWLLFCLDRLFAGERIRPWIFFCSALCFSCSILSGSLPMAGYVFAAGFAYGIFLAFTGNQCTSKTRISRIVLLISVFIAGAAVCAVQLLPFLEFAGFSVRTSGFDLTTATKGSLQWSELSNLFLKNRPETELAWLGRIYIGFLPLVLSIIGLITYRSNKRFRCFFAGLAILGLCLSLGRNFPLYRFLYDFIPGFRVLRHPPDAMVLAVFGFSVLSAYGFERVRQYIDSRTRFPFWTVLAVFFLVFDLFCNGMDEIPITGKKFFTEPTSIIRFLQKQEGLFRVYLTPGADRRMNDYIMTRGENPETLTMAKNILFPNLNIPFGISVAGGYDPMQLYRTENVLDILRTQPSARATRLLDLMNVRYVISDCPLKEAGFKLEMEESGVYNKTAKTTGLPVDEAARKNGEAAQSVSNTTASAVDIYLYRNEDAMPRAWLVKKILPGLSGEQALSAIRSRDFNPQGNMVSDQALTDDSTNGVPDKDEKVVINSYFPDEVKMDVALKTKGCLILADAYYPGWRVRVDGHPGKEILKADYFLRGICIEPGKHSVVFEYQPFSFYIGLLVSCAAMLGLLVFVLCNPVRCKVNEN